MKVKTEAEALAASAPKLRDSDIKLINSHFEAYIFRKSKTGEIWTTCCGKNEIISKNKTTAAKYKGIMTAKHQSETVKTMSTYGHSEYSAPIPHVYRKYTSCPYCGAKALVKELGSTGTRKNLTQCKTFALLRWYRNSLWAIYLSATKSYEGTYHNTYSLTNPPSIYISNIYKFKPGCAHRILLDRWGGKLNLSKLNAFPEKLPLSFYEPGCFTNVSHWEYTLLGLGEIEKSPFRYCQVEQYANRNKGSFFRFLALCCIAPRQVEMLMKLGLDKIIEDLIVFKKKHSAIFNWQEINPIKSFGISRDELKTWLSGIVDAEQAIEVLKFYKQFKRRKIKATFSEIAEVMRGCFPNNIPIVMKMLKRLGLSPAKWYGYISDCCIEMECEELYSQQCVQLWLDYIDAAAVCGLEMKNPLIQTPRHLLTKHDQVTAAANVILEEKRTEEEKKREAELRAIAKPVFESNAKKYSFATDKYIITPPLDSKAIVNEGKLLKHCVGGYADRHMSGVLTILFLRSADDPNTPLVTIEMQGNRLVQMHGFRNDLGTGIKPEEKYSEIIEPWLIWIKSGSKRNKDGTPKLKQTKTAMSALNAAS